MSTWKFVLFVAVVCIVYPKVYRWIMTRSAKPAEVETVAAANEPGPSYGPDGFMVEVEPVEPDRTVVRFSCRECGTCPVDVPIERALISHQNLPARGEYEILAACTACGAPLVSGVIDADRAAELIGLGAVNEYAHLVSFRNELALFENS